MLRGDPVDVVAADPLESSIISASRSGGAGSPFTRQEMSLFWQKTQRRLQPLKKIVPEPR